MVIDKSLDIYTYLNKLFNIDEITNLIENKKVLYKTFDDKAKVNTVSYFILREKNGYSGDMSDVVRYTIQIDLYSNTNFTALLKEIKKQMKENDCKKVEIEDGFDKDFKYYKVLRYNVYLEE